MRVSTLEEIAKLGHDIEIEVQGAASPTDTYGFYFRRCCHYPGAEKIEDS